MLKNESLYLVLGAILFLSGCTPFRPPLHQYESYRKAGVDDKDLIAQMIKCGYPDGTGFVGGNGYNVTREMRIRADQCMLRAGYRFRDGFGGICSTEHLKDHPACKE